VGALLVQRTTWRNAALAIERLKGSQCLTAECLTALDTDSLEALIKPAGFFRVKALRLRQLAKFVVAVGGIDALSLRPTAELREQLLDLPGIGAETADAILGYAFGRPVLVVDAYARRLFSRLHHPAPAMPDIQLKEDAESMLRTTAALNEFHALVIAHGQGCCAPTPRCDSCGLKSICGFAEAA